MNLTAKRVLILFSVCLNLGFLASAAQHLLFRDTDSRHRGHFLQAMEAVQMSDAQREAMLDLQARLRANMSQWREETRQLKADSIEALTAASGPDQARMDANLDEEARIMRARLGKAKDLFVETLDILGRDKARQFGNALLASAGRR